MSEASFRPMNRETGFRPLPFATGHGGWSPAADPPPPADQTDDPVAAAYAQGQADAEAACAADYHSRLSECEADFARRSAMQSVLEDGWRGTLEERLRETVLALCDGVLGELTHDAASLAKRCETAARLLEPELLGCTAMLHPEDLEMLRSILPPELSSQPDPTLERGNFRIEATAGGIEDGLSHWRAKLAAALA